VRPATSTFWQTAIVWLLFLASVGTLLVNSVIAFMLPGQEQTVRRQLQEAALKLVDAAASAENVENGDRNISHAMNQRLEELTRGALQLYPGVEGGLYFDRPRDEFAGYAFPSEPNGHPHIARRDPPPREEPYIRLQARQSATQEGGEPLVQSRDVGPSRVLVATAPVGTARPAPLVVWLMYRLTGPEQQHVQIRRYQVSTVLALGGIAAAMVLTWRLGRNLGREREARERLRDELRRSEHLASLGTLLAQVAHEVRNPLAGIRSTVQLWQRLPAESRTPESLAAVIAAVDRLDALLHQLLYFSRSENSDRQLVNLNGIVRDSLELLRAQAAQQNVTVDTDLDSNLPEIRGSAPALRRVSLNLATNALQSMPEGGRLICRTRRRPDGSVELEIADTGTGIDPAIRARLFEPFFTTRPQGTGLGLALCREIILQHDGRIELEPASPHGTVCRVAFPVPNADK
jgi:signal transduction histidine kinase